MKLSSTLILSIAVVANAQLRAVNINEGSPRRLTPLQLEDGSFEVPDEHGRKVEAKLNGNSHMLKITLGPGKVIQIKSSPHDQELEIRKLGRLKKNDLSDDDRTFLESVALGLENEDTMDTDSVDATPSQAARMGHLLAEWPEMLDIDYEFDAEAEMDRLANEPEREVLSPDGDRRRILASDQITYDDQGNRRLAYTSICHLYGYYVATTHDDWNYDRWDDRSTYYALVSMHPGGPCSDDTYFCQNGAWRCFEPDHSSTIELAYGQCFGRCGAGCGSNTQFTYDCLDHDGCVRFGHATASLWCNDEFSSTIDDAAFAPNCGTPSVPNLSVPPPIVPGYC